MSDVNLWREEDQISLAMGGWAVVSVDVDGGRHLKAVFDHEADADEYCDYLATLGKHREVLELVPTDRMREWLWKFRFDAGRGE